MGRHALNSILNLAHWLASKKNENCVEMYANGLAFICIATPQTQPEYPLQDEAFFQAEKNLSFPVFKSQTCLSLAMINSLNKDINCAKKYCFKDSKKS